VAAAFRSRLRMLHRPVAVLRPQLLIGGLHLHRRLAADRLRPPGDDLADLPHGRQLLRLFQPLRPFLAADAAAWLLAGLFGIAVPGPFALLLLRVLRLLARLAILCVRLLVLALLL